VFGFVYSYSVYTNIFTNTKLANKGTNNAKTLALLVFIKPAARLLVRMRASRALLVSSFVDHPEYKALVFRGDFGLKSSPYSGPSSAENTAEWKALYNYRSSASCRDRSIAQTFSY